MEFVVLIMQLGSQAQPVSGYKLDYYYYYYYYYYNYYYDPSVDPKQRLS